MNPHVILSILLGIAAAIYLLLGIRLIRNKRQIGGRPLAFLFLIVSYWVVGGAIELVATSHLVFTIGRTGHFVGTALVPVALLLCFRDFIGRTTSTQAIIALTIIPVLSVIIAATNHWHEFMWQLPAIYEPGPFLTRPAEFGPWFYFIHLPYGYALTAISMLTLMTHSSAVAPSQRRGLFVLAGSAVVPVVAIIAYDFGIGPNSISTLPIIFAVMLPIYAWMIFGARIIEFSPLAYETVFRNMQDPVIVIDDQERIISLNPGAESLLNMTEVDALREPLEKIFGEQAMEVHTAIETGEPQKMLTNSGRFLHVQVTPIANDKSISSNASVLMFRDVSDVEKAQREVLNSEKLLRTLIDHSVNGIIRLRWIASDVPGGNKQLRCIFANAAAGRYLNSDPEKMIDCAAETLLRFATAGMDSEDAAALLKEFYLAAEAGKVVDIETRVGTGASAKWFRLIAEPVGDDVAMTFVDITDRKAKEKKMESIARSDPLTGVLNRRGFEHLAATRLKESADDATGALLFIDLNNFKQINDQYGHEIGDQLLTVAAKRLQKSLRSCDVVGRPGGDEFVALVPDVEAEVAEHLAARLTKALEQIYLIDGKELWCAASIGLALYPEHANTLTGLLRAADAAMYRAKARCRGVTNISDSALLEKAI